MRKRFRWVLYFLAAILLGFNIWQYFQHKSSAAIDSILGKYNKDLGISDLNPANPPDFTLTDQNGKTISLADFKNKKLVIQPLDPRCKDICPLISQELINADKLMGKEADNVVYIGLNVNENHNKVSDVKSFSEQEGLSGLKNWHFLTGAAEDLKKVWKAYGIAVVPSKTGDVMHTSMLLFVNSKGKEMYDGSPQDDGSSIKKWSGAISDIVKAMP